MILTKDTHQHHWMVYSSLLVMRLHHLWPRKSQNCTIPVNLEAVWSLYLGYNRVLHYIVYGLWLSNFNISLASLDLSTIFKYILKKSNYLQLLQSSTETASYDLRLQSQQAPSVSSVPSDSLKLNSTGSVSFDSVFSRYQSLFHSSVHFNTNFGSIAASRIYVP